MSRVELTHEAFATLATHPIFREIWESGPLHQEMQNLRERMMHEKDPNEMFQLRAELKGMEQVRKIIERNAQQPQEVKPKRRAPWLSPWLPRALGG